jgi:hypothetical protein
MFEVANLLYKKSARSHFAADRYSRVIPLTRSTASAFKSQEKITKCSLKLGTVAEIPGSTTVPVIVAPAGTFLSRSGPSFPSPLGPFLCRSTWAQNGDLVRRTDARGKMLKQSRSSSNFRANFDAGVKQDNFPHPLRRLRGPS